MVELLKEHFEYNEYLLKLFSHINDPYVIQRLYGIAFGACVKRTCENKEKYKKLVYFVLKISLIRILCIQIFYCVIMQDLSSNDIL